MTKKFNVAAQVTHVALPVKDVEASVAFYKKWCGMEIVYNDHPGVKDEKSVWIACPGQEKDFVIVLLPGGQGNVSSEGMRHIGFALKTKEEIAELAKVAEDDGVLHWPYQEHNDPVGTLCSIKDPDGYIVEFSAGQPLGSFYDFTKDGGANDNKGCALNDKKLSP